MMLFTVDQANRTLPLVRRIVEDIVREQRRWQDKLAELELLSSSARADVPNPRLALLEKSIQSTARELDAFEQELGQLGIQLKDRRIGLIDFPSELDGRSMLLCWRLGEESVQFWHDHDAGFAGRQPLTPTFVG